MQSCVQKAIIFIERNIDTHISVAELARLCGKSFHAFRCEFARKTGLSPRRFIAQRRVRAAIAMLSETDAPLADVAYAVGFSSQAKFTTAFRREVGMTPGEFKRSREAEGLSSRSSTRHRTIGDRLEVVRLARSSNNTLCAAALLGALIPEGFHGALALRVLL